MWKRKLRATVRRALPAAGLLILAVTIGCSTTDTPKQAAYSDEVQKELSQTRFRGRWWNYYQRGIVLMRHGDYASAETDFRTAMSKRAADTRWARTYGLHFLPEYFPNRELGVVAFELGDYETAETYLERSFGQQDSARGAYYLDRVRERRVREKDEDREEPGLSFQDPAPEAAVADLEFTLRATATDDTFVRAVEVDGSPLPLKVTAKSFSFEHKVALAPGQNRIEVSVTDIVGKRTTRAYELRADHDGPAVSYEIATGGKQVRGYLADETGVKSFEVAGQSVPLTAVADGRKEFVAELPASGGPADYICRDTLGNETRGSLAPGQGQRVALAMAGDGAAVARWVMLSAAPAPEGASGLRLELMNIADGQRYFSDNVIVGLAVESDTVVERVEINGEVLPGILRQAGAQRVTRRVVLDEVGEHEIVARVVTRDEHRTEARARIERRLPQVLENASRLRVALLGNLWAGSTETVADLATFILSDLPAAIRTSQRFSVLDRESLELALSEQELSQALSTISERVRIGRIESADYLLIGDVRPFGGNLEVVLHVINAATGEEILVDVYGPGDTAADIQELTRLLSGRLAQEFPTARGEITSVKGSGDRLETTLSERDRIWESYPCIVYREVEVIDPSTQQSLGKDWIPVAKGVVSNLRRDSSVVLVDRGAEAAGESPKVSDYVLTR